MKYQFINKDIDDNVILFFAGWGMDKYPFQWAKNISLDFVVIYDYSDFSIDIDLSHYKNIYVFAWSFGVYAASKWLADSRQPILSVAINGTPKPIDDQLGIPVSVFNGTLDYLSEASLLKFNKRMCGLANLGNFNAVKPDRDIESLRLELVSMQDASNQNCKLFEDWDKVFISGKDYIFPTANQKNYWCNHNSIIIDLENDFHYPSDFQSIFESCLIDKDSVRQKFENSFSRYDEYAIGQSIIAEELMAKWQNHSIIKDSTILEIGCGTGLFSKIYSRRIRPRKIFLNDIATIPDTVLPNGVNYEKIEGDAENCQFPNGLDYLVSTSAIQWFENPSCFIKKTYNLLNKGGYLVVSTFGSNNMIELRDFFKTSLNYLNAEHWEKMLSDAGYAEIEITEDCFKTHYDSIQELLKGLKRTGVNGLKSASTLNKSTLLRMESEMPTDDGGYFLSFNPIYIIAKKTEQ